MAIKILCDRCGAECVYEVAYSKLEACGQDSYNRRSLYLCEECTAKVLKAIGVSDKKEAEKDAKKEAKK